MTGCRVVFFIAAALAAVSGPVLAQERGNTKEGEMLAQMTCAQCHAVERHQLRSPNQHAPTFEAIARMRGISAMAIRVALRTSHREMPNLSLTTDEVDDVAAYILDLK